MKRQAGIAGPDRHGTFAVVLDNGSIPMDGFAEWSYAKHWAEARGYEVIGRSAAPSKPRRSQRAPNPNRRRSSSIRRVSVVERYPWFEVDGPNGPVTAERFKSAAKARAWARDHGFTVARGSAKDAKRGKRRKRGRRRNPQLLTVNPARRPTDAEIAKAAEAYERFHGVKPKRSQIHVGRGKGILIGLGELKRVDYKAARGHRSGPTWFHHFKAGATLATDPEGKRLVVVDRKGKTLVDFDRGIIR